jgi:hypothetical protein
MHTEFWWSSFLENVHLVEREGDDRIALTQLFLTCGPRTPVVRDAYSGGPRLFRKLNNFPQQINKVYIRKKAKSEIENYRTLCKSEGIWN